MMKKAVFRAPETGGKGASGRPMGEGPKPAGRMGEASEIARGLLSKNPREQKASLRKLSENANALLFVAKSHPAKEGRDAARENLYVLANKDMDCIPQEGLVLLLTEQSDYYTLWVKMLEKVSGNSEALRKVVLHPDTHPDIALSAVRETRDVGALKEFASLDFSESRNYNIAAEATEVLAGMVGELTDTEALVRVALCSMDEGARLAAVGRLRGNADGLRRVISGSVGVRREEGGTDFPPTLIEAAGHLSGMVWALSDEEVLDFLSAQEGIEKVDKGGMLEALGGAGRIAALSKIIDSEGHAEFHARAKELREKAFSEGLQGALEES